MVMRLQVPMSSSARLHLLLVTLPCVERGPHTKGKSFYRSRVQCCSWPKEWPISTVGGKAVTLEFCALPCTTLLHVARLLESLLVTDLL